MNQSISDVIEIMALVREQFDAEPMTYRIKQYRINALNQIAHRRSRERNTIANAYIRGLEPHIKGTVEFQKYLNEWLTERSNVLVDIILDLLPEWEREEAFSNINSRP